MLYKNLLAITIILIPVVLLAQTGKDRESYFKKRFISYFAFISLLTLTAATIADDIISKLGMRPADAKKAILDNMLAEFGGFRIPNAKLLPAIVKGDKVGAAKDLCKYVKMYCNSEDFIADYEQYRNSFKPKSDKPRDPNVEKANQDLINIYKEQIAMYEKSLADAKKQKDQNAIKLYENGLADGRKNLAALEDPNPAKTAWEKKYPANPTSFVKVRLEEYLSLVATVDFDAKLTPKGNKMIFVNPDYERKSKKWKAIFRAGKEVNQEVTAFVKEWLKGEIISEKKTKMPEDPEKSTASLSTDSRLLNSNQPNSPLPDNIESKTNRGLNSIKNKIIRLGKQ